MVNRRNYRLVQEYLAYQSEVAQLDPRSVDRYWFYLKYLLLWADEILFGEIMQRSTDLRVVLDHQSTRRRQRRTLARHAQRRSFKRSSGS